MNILADTDLVVFLSTISQILILGPLNLRKNLRPLPRQFQIEHLPTEALTAVQQKYLQAFDEKMGKLNYWPVTTYRAANYGRNLIRSYVNPMEPVRCVLMLVEVTVNVNGVRSSRHSSTIEFFTYFTDETVLVTRNMQLKSVFEEPPYRITQECPRVSDPAELRRRHLARIAQLNRVPRPSAADVAATSREFQSGHERFCQYQLERGNLRPDRSGNWYFVTSRVHWRGIANHLNPFVQRFAMRRFLPAAISGIALPVFARLFGAQMAASAVAGAGISADMAAKLAVGTGYAAAGAITGMCLQKSNFLWTFILTYLGVGAILGFHTNPLPYGTIAALTADLFARWQKGRKLILLPSVPIARRATAT
jgi:hypothetical protein